MTNYFFLHLPTFSILFLTIVGLSGQPVFAQSFFDGMNNNDLEELWLDKRNICDPTTICGGELTAPPSGCIFSRDDNCQQERKSIYDAWVQEQVEQGHSGRQAPENNVEARNVVAIVNYRGVVICTGTALPNNLVITAQHCLDQIDASDDMIFFGSSIKPARINGDNIIHDGWLFGITGTFALCRDVYEGGNTCDSPIDADLGVVRYDTDGKEIDPSFLFDPVATYSFFAEALFNRSRFIFFPDYESATIYGFGANEQENGGGQKRYAVIRNLTLRETVLTAEDDQADACKGDSGGPVWSGGALIGIIRSGEDCGAGGEYTAIFNDSFTSENSDMISNYDDSWFLEYMKYASTSLNQAEDFIMSYSSDPDDFLESFPVHWIIEIAEVN